MKRLTSLLSNTKKAIKPFLVGALSSAVLANSAMALTPPKALVEQGEKQKTTSIDPFRVSHENKDFLPDNPNFGKYTQINVGAYTDMGAEDLLKNIKIFVDGKLRKICFNKNKNNGIYCETFASSNKDRSYQVVATTRDGKTRKSELKYFYGCDDNGNYVEDGECLSTQPFFCEEGNIVSNSDFCGCPKGFVQEGDTCINDPLEGYEISPVSLSGDKKDKADIVFFYHGYEEDNFKGELQDTYQNYSYNPSFKEDVQKSIDTILSIEPYASNKDKFNWYVAIKNPDLNCFRDTENGSKRSIVCDNFEVQEVLDYAGYDKAVILTTEIEGSGGTNFGDVSTSTSGDSYIVAHELTHALGIEDGGIHDEYNVEVPSEYARQDRNCAPTLETCEEWQQENPEIECVQGCYKDSWYRTSERSLMYDLSPHLSPKAREIVEESLNKHYR